MYVRRALATILLISYLHVISSACCKWHQDMLHHLQRECFICLVVVCHQGLQVFWRTEQVKVKVTLRLAVYCQSVHLGAKPLQAHNQRYFSSTEPLQSRNILSDEKTCLSLMNMLGLLSSIHIAHTECYWKFFFCTIYNFSVTTGGMR
jgi:hypothetical protein